MLHRAIRVIIALGLLAVSATANAVTLMLVSHNQTSSSGTISTAITDGSHVSGIAGATTAIFDWDGTTLTSSGLYSSVFSLSSSTTGATILSDQIVDLSINTSTATVSATAYTCLEGTFLATVNQGACSGIDFGANEINETTTVWGPGTAVSQTIGGDDILDGSPRRIQYDVFRNYDTASFDGTTLLIGNGVALGSLGSELLTFQIIPVPATVWLFGSALGLLGCVRRKA